MGLLGACVGSEIGHWRALSGRPASGDSTSAMFQASFC
jgi:hypothetical protein